MKSCRICGFINKPEAERCAVCQSEFAPESIKYTGKTGRRKPLSTVAEVAIIFGITCVLMLPFLSWLNTVWWLNDHLVLITIGVFAIIFTALFLGYTFARKAYDKKQAEKFLDENDPNALFVHNDISEEIDTEAKQVFQARQDLSRIPFSEQLFAVSQQTPNTELQFNEEMTVSEAATQMAKPLDIPSSQLRTTLAAMASRRLVIVCGDNDGQTIAALQPVTALTGTEPFDAALGEDCTDPTALFVKEDPENGPLPSQFLNGLCTGGESSALCHVSVKAAAANQVSTAFADLTPYLEYAFTEFQVTVKGVNRKYANISGDEPVTLPANRRIFLRVSSDRQIPFDAELLRNAAWVEAKSFSSREGMEDTSDESETATALSFEHFLQLIDESEKMYYIPEETWKRIDELCDYLEQTLEFRMDNKLATAMERFVGIYMASGGTEQEATDAVIASLILPQVLALLSCKQDRDHGPLLQFIDGHFGMENLPACADFLKKYGTI